MLVYRSCMRSLRGYVKRQHTGHVVSLLSSISGSKGPRKRTSFSVDTSGLGKVPDENLWMKDIPDVEGKEKLTDLGREIQRYIQMRGPITVHEYMSLATNHATLGYYRRKTEKIGRDGDFITSPEIRFANPLQLSYTQNVHFHLLIHGQSNIRRDDCSLVCCSMGSYGMSSKVYSSGDGSWHWCANEGYDTMFREISKVQSVFKRCYDWVEHRVARRTAAVLVR